MLVTTTLLALTFAVNVESTLRESQRAYFRATGDASSRLLPPCVPVTFITAALADAKLDDLRKRNPVRLVATDETMVLFGSSSVILPIQLSGWDRLRQMIHLLGNSAEIAVPPICVEEPAVHLAWEGPRGWSSPAPQISSTSAFWLTQIEITPGERRWWDGCIYRIIYRRRLSVRQR